LDAPVRVRSSVRPFGAAHAAGPDGFRERLPNIAAACLAVGARGVGVRRSARSSSSPARCLRRGLAAGGQALTSAVPRGASPRAIMAQTGSPRRRLRGVPPKREIFLASATAASLRARSASSHGGRPGRSRLSVADHRSGTEHQQLAQAFVAGTADPAPARSAGSGVQLRRQAEPGREVPAVGEALWRGAERQRQGGLRADAGHDGREPASGVAACSADSRRSSAASSASSWSSRPASSASASLAGGGVLAASTAAISASIRPIPFAPHRRTWPRGRAARSPPGSASAPTARATRAASPPPAPTPRAPARTAYPDARRLRRSPRRRSDRSCRV